MNAVNLFFAWIKVKYWHLSHKNITQTFLNYLACASSKGFLLLSFRFSSTSVLTRPWHSCPPHLVDVLKIFWASPSCSSLYFLPMLNLDICSLEQRLNLSVPSSSACKRHPINNSSAGHTTGRLSTDESILFFLSAASHSSGLFLETLITMPSTELTEFLGQSTLSPMCSLFSLFYW